MAEQKTKASALSVDQFIKKIDDPQRREDCLALIDIMKNATRENPVMWGTSIIGFGSYHYKYASGHEGDSCLAGFSPRKGNFAIYGMGKLADDENLQAKLGKCKMGKGCLYINRLADVDTKLLGKLVAESAAAMKKKKW